MAAPLQVAAALAIALMLNNKKMAAVGVWRTLYYMPSIVSGIAVSLLWMWMLNPDFGLLNYLLGLIGIHGPALGLLRAVGHTILRDHGRVGGRRQHAALPGRPAEHPHAPL